jgi:hypothetical protein
MKGAEAIREEVEHVLLEDPVIVEADSYPMSS